MHSCAKNRVDSLVKRKERSFFCYSNQTQRISYTYYISTSRIIKVYLKFRKPVREALFFLINWDNLEVVLKIIKCLNFDFELGDIKMSWWSYSKRRLNDISLLVIYMRNNLKVYYCALITWNEVVNILLKTVENVSGWDIIGVHFLTWLKKGKIRINRK